MKPTDFKPVADRALLVEFGTEIDDDINRYVISLDHEIAKADIPGVQEVTPALVNLLVVFDPLITDHAKIRTAIEQILPEGKNAGEIGRKHILNACYEEDISPDLHPVAEACGLSTEELINIHTSTEYRVGMYGFVPGFAYLTGVPKAIQVPRKTEPAPGVAEGNIIIAGAQCIVTTLNMPSGWHVIGKSDVQIMSNDPEQGFLFDVGDTVVFQRVSRDELKWIAQ